MSQPLRLETRNRAAIVTLDRPARRNSLSRDTLEAFAQLETAILSDPQLRAIILTGSGDRAFCAGADLKERQAMSDNQVREQLRAYRTCLGWLDTSPLPVVAALNGAAIGGGLELALLADLRVAAPNAVLALPETSLGIIPGAGGTQRLTRLLGEARAKQLILLGQRLDARQAFELGLVQHLATSPATLIEETLAWIEPILQGAPIAQAAALAAIDAASELPLAEGLERELELYERCLVSDDRQEALRALAEKREPQFRGK